VIVLLGIIKFSNFYMNKVLLSLVAIVFVFGSINFADAATGYGGGNSSGSRVKNRVTTPAPLVLGASTSTAAFKFLVDMRVGSNHADVIELQKVLIAQGHLKIAAPTGFFGPLTLAAVKAYQAANPEIGYVTGFCGPLTRTALNK
jgi:peptidoglycan hydrolase-like protein with peptidoglycan-binding domain